MTHTNEYIQTVITELLNGETLIRKYPGNEFTLYKLINGKLNSSLNYSFTNDNSFSETSSEDLFHAAHYNFPLEIYKEETTHPQGE